MTNLITSYLIQTGECALPGIGSFSVITHPARHDVAGKEMFPPVAEMHFTENTEPLSKKFIHYISLKKEIEEKEAVETIQNWCKELKDKLESGEFISFPTLGRLQKDDSENIVFSPAEEFTFNEPLPAIRVVHKEESHSVLVGDKESNSSEMNAFLNEEPEEKSNNSFWKIAAVILFVIGIGIIFYHLFTSEATNKLGNGTKIHPEVPHNTYIAK